MRSIQVQSPGMFTTVQDLGRCGFGPLGISPSGAADPIALRLGNRLVGNSENLPALEMTLLGGAFVFFHDTVVALAGADFGTTLDGTAIPPWRSFKVAAGQVLQSGSTLSGARCYLCVRGGINVKPFLGSASTHVLSGLGGLEGRALRKGDVLEIGPGPDNFHPRRVSYRLLDRIAPRKTLRVTAGPQSEWFPESSRRQLHDSPYSVTEDSNRMGLRLEGGAISAYPDKEMITEGVSLGAIQVPPGGQPIILFVEQQTTGGYPKIANMISADLPSVGQLRPRDQVQFELVSIEMAHSLLAEQEHLLTSEDSIVEMD